MQSETHDHHTEAVALPFRAIYDAGVQLKVDVEQHLVSWPTRGAHWLRNDDLTPEFVSVVEVLRDRAYRWFNLVTANVLPHTTHHRAHVTGCYGR